MAHPENHWSICISGFEMPEFVGRWGDYFFDLPHMHCFLTLVDESTGECVKELHPTFYDPKSGKTGKEAGCLLGFQLNIIAASLGIQNYFMRMVQALKLDGYITRVAVREVIKSKKRLRLSSTNAHYCVVSGSRSEMEALWSKACEAGDVITGDQSAFIPFSIQDNVNNCHTVLEGILAELNMHIMRDQFPQYSMPGLK